MQPLRVELRIAARFDLALQSQKINRSHAHAHKSKTNHSHEHRASNGATTLTSRSP